MPFLFHLREGGRSRGISMGATRRWLIDTANALDLREVNGTPLRFTPHDFRRMFITALVNDVYRSTSPRRSSATPTSRPSAATSRSIRGTSFVAYDKFIASRRTLRPSQEYREPTQQEWTEFEEHFLRRKVSLGNCRRAYGSGCSHEHACIRCQFLQVHPAQMGQLNAIEANLRARVDEAGANSWLGDVDQLLVTLGHLDRKKEQVQQMLASLPTPLLTASCRRGD